MRSLTRTEIRQLARAIGVRPRLALGQHFLHDASTVRRIVAALGLQRADHVLEAGAGLGSLTLALLDRGARVTAVEADPVLARQLPVTVGDHLPRASARLTALHSDILSLTGEHLTDAPTVLLADLPDRIAVPALLHLLAEFPSIRTAMVLVQADRAARLTAPPGDKAYGVSTIKVRFFGDVHRYGMVSPTTLWPIPRVYRGLVRVDRHLCPSWPTDAQFRGQVFEFVETVFTRRDRSARTALASWAGSGDESARRLLAASIHPSRRIESLTAADYARILQRSGDWHSVSDPLPAEPALPSPQGG